MGLLCPWNSAGRNTGVGCHFPPPGDLPDPGIEASSPALQADSLRSEPSWEPSFHLEVPLKQAGEQVRDAGVS